MEAFFAESLGDNIVRCGLCAHRCKIKPGRRGLCHVRENRNGQLHTLVYGRLIASHVDPIEKKPLFHLLPGSRSYSIATVGCNFRCRFCQNADIAQMPADHNGRIAGSAVSARDVVEDALSQGCASIAYTYTEPTIYFEFACDTALIAHDAGLKNVFVTNGYMTGQALDMIAPYLDGANVDLKAYSDHYYKKLCGARLEPVKQTLIRMKKKGILVEVTTLVVPGHNDDDEQLAGLAGFIADELGADTPWHISRFHPTYKLTNQPPTPVDTLVRAREIGRKAGLNHIYLGNVPGMDGESTFCPGCGQMVIERYGFSIRQNRIEDGRCPECRAEIYGVGLSGH